MQLSQDSAPNVQVEPFLRWAGSKRKLVNRLSEYYPSGARRYVEPFVGSACLFFSIAPSKAILGDLNRELVSTYLEIKHRVDAVASELSGLRRSRDRYIKYRKQNPAKLSPAARAVRFIYLNRYCFNGLYRTNMKGEFNVPYGGKGTGRLPSAEQLRSVSTALSSARFVCGDFRRTLKLVQPGDFVYMDPPFATAERRVFREYDKSIFSGTDLLRLRIWLDHLHKIGAKFLVSYAECDESEWLSRGFCKEYVTVRRNIAGFAKHRVKSSEILISNS